MASQPCTHRARGYPKAIYLYTTPLRYQRNLFKLKKPIDVFAHWAICIQDRCYELTRNTDRDKKKKEPKYFIKVTEEQEWLRQKA